MRLLREGELYTIFDSGLARWLDNFIYIGYNSLRDEHIFRSNTQFNRDCFIYLENAFIRQDVLELNLVEQRERKLNNILY